MDLLPEGLEYGDPSTVLKATLAGIVFFFLAEGFLHWFHHHHSHKESNHDPSVWLVVFGDTAHNALDGVAIAASFLVSVPTGIVTTLAVAAHEIPQEIGDFGILLSKGMKRLEVLLVNLTSALATVFFAVVTFSLGSEDRLPIGALLGVSAGFLLYIAMSDVIPTIHDKKERKKAFQVQAGLFLLGLIVVWSSIVLIHSLVDVSV